MARTNLVAQTLPGAYPTLPVGVGSRELTTVAMDVVNGNDTAIVDGKTVVLFYNSDSGAHTVTFTSAADSLGRTGDITAYSIAAGRLAIFGAFKLVGWTHSGKLQIDASDVTVKVAVITLP